MNKTENFPNSAFNDLEKKEISQGYPSSSSSRPTPHWLMPGAARLGQADVGCFFTFAIVAPTRKMQYFPEHSVKESKHMAALPESQQGMAAG